LSEAKPPSLLVRKLYHVMLQFEAQLALLSKVKPRPVAHASDLDRWMEAFASLRDRDPALSDERMLAFFEGLSEALSAQLSELRALIARRERNV
jgi:hypothetical protein